MISIMFLLKAICLRFLSTLRVYNYKSKRRNARLYLIFTMILSAETTTIYLFNNHLLETYYVQGTMHSFGDTEMRKTQSCSQGAPILKGGQTSFQQL